MKAIFILFDSLNRHALPIYGSDWAKAPNFERLARRSVVFDNHWLGSAPCMPARRDMQTGRLSFLERMWGGIEPFEFHRTLPQLLKKKGVFSHIETDHYHYWYGGGEGYCNTFDTFAFHRGQEFDRWVSRVKPLEPPGPFIGRMDQYHLQNRSRFKTDADYPTPRTLAGAAQWLRENEGSDNWFLWVEAFDPHEPFDTPDAELAAYNDTYGGPKYLLHKYGLVEKTPGSVEHDRNRYAATVTMADRWLGKLFDEIDRQNLWEDTLLVLTTDHGHFVGERGYNGKNLYHCYNVLAHIPLVVHLPADRCAGERRGQLTQNIDLLPTVCDYFGFPVEHAIHGRSWRPILDANQSNGREYCLYGWFGSSVNVTDGRFTYLRAPARPDNQPLYAYGLMPSEFHGFWSPDECRRLEAGRFLRYADCPVWRFRCEGESREFIHENGLYDLGRDYEQTNNLACAPGSTPDELERQYADLLRRAMNENDSPLEQFVRMGLVSL